MYYICVYLYVKRTYSGEEWIVLTILNLHKKNKETYVYSFCRNMNLSSRAPVIIIMKHRVQYYIEDLHPV